MIIVYETVTINKKIHFVRKFNKTYRNTFDSLILAGSWIRFRTIVELNLNLCF